jgi:hypothetical protein
MALDTAPRRSDARRWTARGLVVGLTATSALAVGVATATAAEVPHIDDHGLSDMLAEHGVHIGTLLEHDEDTTHAKSDKKSEEKSKKTDKADEKDKD